ncbi:hypothetical protein BH20ACT2_BH20ACT2_09710 [soil metagenome]
MLLATRALLAHQGGWDETLLVAAPIAVFAGILLLANRRAEARLRAEAADHPDEQGSGQG